mmetsp:Transcript_29011/g.70753  ORF Transcript_29011/g.70753 Transcript_29011/m.70753 type:complete len:126 (+) Transcript_29011:83-460(+)
MNQINSPLSIEYWIGRFQSHLGSVFLCHRDTLLDGERSNALLMRENAGIGRCIFRKYVPCGIAFHYLAKIHRSRIIQNTSDSSKDNKFNRLFCAHLPGILTTVMCESHTNPAQSIKSALFQCRVS